ncbi:hypothetical protein AVM47_033145 [Pseudomonas aeruginosa]|uniref:hypothetical protein n=1 Tax=Pseudomonas aeruginosa TaxID=287 RepID=UPI0019033A11|nr:hypothetical protein [Pseudomonas aeruginosa]MBK1802753.1 hypothetical protein [Pseudomonas aeruginosa]
MNRIKTLTAIVAMTAAFSVNAGYRIQIPLEVAGGGNLSNGSIVFTGITETTPQEPETTPQEPETTPQEPEIPQRNLVSQVSFFEDVVTYKGFYSANKLSKIYPNMMIFETILESGKDYYLSNTGFDCVFTANVCTMNISEALGGCVVSDESLSGIKTELIFKKPAVGNVCFIETFGNAANGFAKSYQDIKIYDGE